MFIGFVGNLSISKGIFHLNKLANSLSNYNISFNAYGRRYANSPIDNSCIRYMGFKSRNEIYNNIDILCLLSWGEGSARVIYEALSFDIPVICSVESGSPFEDESSWVFKHNDIVSFQNLLVKIINDRKYLHELLAKQKKVISRFTKKRYINSVQNLYKKI